MSASDSEHSTKRAEFILRYLTWLDATNRPVEIRALGTNRRPDTQVAYARSADETVHLAELAEDGGDGFMPLAASGIYMASGRLKPGVEARYPSGWQAARDTVTDGDIVAYQVVPVDFDVQRPKGISSTRDEWRAAIATMKIALEQLRGMLPRKVLATAASGNGAHLLVRVELPVTKENKELVARFLAVAGRLWNSTIDRHVVKVDQSLKNPARIIPLYGTLKRKGHHTEERPHRRTSFHPDEEQPTPLTPEEFKALVLKLEKLAPPPDPKAAKKTSPRATTIIKSTSWKSKVGDIPIRDVLTRVVGEEACPACGKPAGPNTFGILDEKLNRNLAMCFSCEADGGPGIEGKPGLFNGVAAVIAAGKAKDNDEAYKYLAEEFGIEVKTPGRKKKPVDTSNKAIRKVVDGDWSRIEAPAPGSGIDIDDGSFDEFGSGSPAASPSLDQMKEALTGHLPLDDIGNGHRFSRRHGGRCRYDHGSGKWWVYELGRWQQDAKGEARSMAQETARGIAEEVQQVDDKDEREAIMEWARSCGFTGKINSMLREAESLMPLPQRQLDRDPWLLNTPGGTVQLRTGEVGRHDPSSFLTKLTKAEPFEYNRGDAPAFEGFLERVQPNPEVRSYLQRVVGYALLGAVREHKLFVFYGSGRNGKGTFLHAVRRALGDYAVSVPKTVMISSRNEPHPTHLMPLRGCRLAVASETADGDFLDVAQVKLLTGGDQITARGMGQDFVTWEPSHTLVMMTNHKPKVPASDDAAWRRIVLVGWNTVIPDGEEDVELPTKLEEEADAILGWAIKGCLAYQRDGLEPPECIARETAEWRRSEDTLADWIEDRCTTGDALKEPAGDLYRDYREWAEKSGLRPWSQQRMGRELERRGFLGAKSNGVRYRFGLQLRSDDQPSDDDFGIDDELFDALAQV